MQENLKIDRAVDNISNDLAPHEENILSLYDSLNLPTNYVLARIDERKIVLKNLNDVIGQIPSEMREKSLYLSKFVSATISGLFDAALNYIWNETIFNLRHKVVAYDINYFFDLIVDSSERLRFRTKEDLEKISDYLLIEGALKLEILDDISYKKLDTIRYMRNNMSAAHPNEHSITGLELVSYLETCVKNVLSRETNSILLSIQLLLKKIKEEEINDDDALIIVKTYENFTDEKLEDLCRGYLGIYCREEQNDLAYKNIERLLPPLWELLDIEFKKEMGIKWQRMLLNENESTKRQVNDFIRLVDGRQYLPNDSRIPKLQVLLKQLLEVHNGYNNFYNEDSYIRMIKEYIGEVEVPNQVEKFYVDTITYVFLTNGNGVAWSADSVYKDLLRKFSNKQIINSLISFKNVETKIKLNYSLCKNKFDELICIFKSAATSIEVKNALNLISSDEINIIGVDEFVYKLVLTAKKLL